MTEPSSDQVEQLRKQLAECMTRKGLKSSRQRDLIADVFFSAGGHLSVDQLLERVRQVDARVSQATVYRTMSLLRECGLAQPRNFLGGQTLYELADQGDEHHDHLICLECDRIVEFVDEQIEKRQHKIADEQGFSVSSHRMELYGKPRRKKDGSCEHCGDKTPNT